MCFVLAFKFNHNSRAITHKQSQLVSSCDNWTRVVEDAENELFAIKAFYAQRNAKKESLAVSKGKMALIFSTKSSKSRRTKRLVRRKSRC